MGVLSDVRVRQPARNDLIGRSFLVAGVGAGFEGTIGIRLVNDAGRVLTEAFAQSSAGGIGIGEFHTTVEVERPPRAATKLTLQVFGDNPGLPDGGPSPGFNTRRVPVIMFPNLRGWLVYRVEPGDTLTGIVRKARDFTRTTVAQIAAANPIVTDSDHIDVGWRLRVPLND